MHPLTRLQFVILNLLDYDEQLIKRGEVNQVRADDETDYIVVNALSPAQPISSGRSYDGEVEQLTVSTNFRMPVTVDFFGLNAYQVALNLQLLLKTDKAAYLQNQHGVTLTAVSALTDVKQLTGSQYINRYQLTLNLLYNESLTIDALRIDRVDIDFNTNE